MLTWVIKHLASTLLAEHHVARAHIAAPHVLAEWQTRGARYWRNAFLSPFVGALVPLLGCVAFGWSPGLVLLALTVDIAMLWICDMLKSLLAPSRVDEERAHHDEAGDVLAVIHALEQPRFPPGRDLLAPAPRRRLYLSSLPSHLHSPRDRPVMIGFTSFCFVLFAYLVIRVAPHAVPWLLAGAALRLCVCVVRTLRARRDPGPRPELLPEAGIPALALFLALYPAFLVFEGFDIDGFSSQQLSLILLTLHGCVAGGLATLGLRHIRRSTEELRAFAARDLQPLKERVRQING